MNFRKLLKTVINMSILVKDKPPTNPTFLVINVEIQTPIINDAITNNTTLISCMSPLNMYLPSLAARPVINEDLSSK